MLSPTCRLVRSSSNVAIIVLTVRDEEKDKIEAFDLNVAGYLVKPVTFPGFAELMATLNKYWTLVDMP